MKYALKLAKKYNVEFYPQSLSGDEKDILSIAKSILPPDKFNQWLDDMKIELYKLRKELNIQPYNLHDSEIEKQKL